VNRDFWGIPSTERDKRFWMGGFMVGLVLMLLLGLVRLLNF
jgi:hypothetical protein